MKWSIHLALFLSAAAVAADPPAATGASSGASTGTSTEAATGTPAILATPQPARPVPASAKPAATPAANERKPLDLRIGHIRNYMMPDEYQGLLRGPEEERNTIVVSANIPLAPMRTELDVPGGIIAPFWALAHPTKAWRIFLPDISAKEAPPPEFKIPPPIFRWGP